MIHYNLLPDQHTWKLTADGGRTVFGDEPARTRALRCAVQIVSANFGKLHVHRADGTIEEIRIYPRADDLAELLASSALITPRPFSSIS